jgi:hypothetical protein
MLTNHFDYVQRLEQETDNLRSTLEIRNAEIRRHQAEIAAQEQITSIKSAVAELRRSNQNEYRNVISNCVVAMAGELDRGRTLFEFRSMFDLIQKYTENPSYSPKQENVESRVKYVLDLIYSTKFNNNNSNKDMDAKCAAFLLSATVHKE